MLLSSRKACVNQQKQGLDNQNGATPQRRFFIFRRFHIIVVFLVLSWHTFIIDKSMLNKIIQLQNWHQTLGSNANETSLRMHDAYHTASMADKSDAAVDNGPALSNSPFREPMVMDLRSWELQSIRKFNNISLETGFKVVPVCRPPVGIHETCCLGSVSTRGSIVREAADLCFKGDAPYDKVARAARQELQRTALLVEDSDECDVCRIMNLIYQHDLKFAITGDSMMLQMFSGLWCELGRRGYIITDNTTYSTFHPSALGIRGLTHLEISGPKQWHKPIRVVFLSQYKPKPDMSEIIQLTSNYDVLVMNFGLHWSWRTRPKYRAVMADVFNATRSGSVQLLAFRETGAQHFNAVAGEWEIGSKTFSCDPWPEGSLSSKQFLWRERAVIRNAAKSGYRIVVADESLPSAGPKRGSEKELVILPFYNFTIPLFDLHPGECTHFCSTPFLWMPVWRSLRLAMDRQWNTRTG